MAAKQEEQQLTGDGFTSHIVGMSKSQLYDIMCQMKVLIEQNHQQARQILIDNPLLTRALFQAQIMLGMVKPSQAVPKIQQQAVSQPQVGTQSNAAEMTQVGVQSEASLPQLPIPARPSASSNLQSQTMPPKNQPQTSSAFVNSIAPPQSSSSQLHNVMPSSSQSSSSQLHNVMPSSSQSSSSQLHNVMPSSGPPHYSHIPMVSGQPQHSLQAPPGLLHQPLPQHLRPPSMQPFAHQMPPGVGFQPSQLYFPQSLFHSGVNPASFSQGQGPLQSQQHLQQGFSDRGGGHWAAEAGGQFTGGPPPPPPPTYFWGQMPQATGGNPPPLAPDVEKALLQQVMSLTPEQISLLPPEQRHQVIQLQEMLR